MGAFHLYLSDAVLTQLKDRARIEGVAPSKLANKLIGDALGASGPGKPATLTEKEKTVMAAFEALRELGRGEEWDRYAVYEIARYAGIYPPSAALVQLRSLERKLWCFTMVGSPWSPGVPSTDVMELWCVRSQRDHAHMVRMMMARKATGDKF